jgi:hypothetical protein
MTEAENQRSAAEALESVRQGRSRLAAESSLPWWRHWLIGLLFGVLVGAQGYPLPIPTFGSAAVVIAIAIIARSDRRRHGFFINGVRRGPTLPVSIAFLVIALAVVFGAVYCGHDLRRPELGALLGLLMVPVGALYSLAWRRAYQRELRSDR